MGYEHENIAIEPWMPIHTLPAEPPMGLPIIIWWEDQASMIRFRDGKWITDDGEDPFDGSSNHPTYWMPLTVPRDVLVKFIEEEISKMDRS